MIDIVYILGKDSGYSNIEVMLSIRSIEQAKLKYRNIVIVGDKPSFLKDVIHIPYQEETGTKAYKIAKKVEFICWQQEVSDNFLFFNDDFFITKYFNVSKYPYYHKGTLERRNTSDAYMMFLQETYLYLKSIGKPTNHFDLHVPIIYNKKKFLELSHIWNKNSNFVVKSTYCNYHNIDGIEKVDFKIKKPTEVDTECFSTYDDLSKGMLSWLFSLYPNPSKYETDKYYNMNTAIQYYDKEEKIERKQYEKFKIKDEKRLAVLIDYKVADIKSIEAVVI